jgi:hypothetical protein
MFATPLWLVALVTLAIPLALHLWSRRPRRVIQVGSLRHLGQHAPLRARSLRLTELPLLVLRTGILASIVLGLAGPRLTGTPLGLIHHLSLVEPALLGDPILDSLNAARAAVRLLAPGLPEVRLPRQADKSVGESLSPWDGLPLADRLLSRGGSIDLYATPGLAGMGEQRPRVRALIRWHAPAPQPTRTWIGALSVAPHDSLQALVGRGDARRITYERVRVKERSDLPIQTVAPIEPLRPRRLEVRADSGNIATDRVRPALEAIASELGQSVTVATDSATADARVTVPTEVVATAALPDTLLTRWPWPPLTSDPADPRTASLAQAVPWSGGSAPDRAPSPHRLEPLLLGAVLLMVERWLATSPSRPR